MDDIDLNLFSNGSPAISSHDSTSSPLIFPSNGHEFDVLMNGDVQHSQVDLCEAAHQSTYTCLSLKFI